MLLASSVVCIGEMKSKPLLLRLFIALALALACSSLAKATTLSVTDFGARGDAVSIVVSTVSNSCTVTILGTNTFTSADVGKVVEVFRAGSSISYNSSLVVTSQDLVATVVGVSASATLTMSLPAGKTLASAHAVLGKNNAAAFQAAVDAADTNTTIMVPAGNYLLLSTQALDPNYVMQSISDGKPAVKISKGGIHFLGDSASNTILLGCGAGMEHSVSSPLTWISPGYAPFVPYRGYLFWCVGPVTASQHPLIFENLTFDGGVINGLQQYNYWTPIQANGDGWDTTHGAVLDWAPADVQMHQEKVFTNCVFQHWRGEMLKSTVAAGGTNAFIKIARCVFDDGNASAINFSFGHHVQGCSFSRLVKVLELYQDHTRLPSVFESNVWTNIASNPFTIVGSTSNRNPPSYVIRSNTMAGIANVNQITLSPAENVIIAHNRFYGPASGVTFSAAGLQPSDGSASIIRNIVILCNTFNDTFLPISMDGYPASDVLVSSNSSASQYAFAIGAGWKSNIVFESNNGRILDSRAITGTWFVDKTSNRFGSWFGDNDWSGRTNTLTYALGREHVISHALSNSVYVVDDATPNRVPSSADMVIIYNGGPSIPLYLSGSSLAGQPVIMTNGYTITCQWSNGVWQLAGNQPPLAAPINLRILQPTNGL